MCFYSLVRNTSLYKWCVCKNHKNCLSQERMEPFPSNHLNTWHVFIKKKKNCTKTRLIHFLQRVDSELNHLNRCTDPNLHIFKPLVCRMIMSVLLFGFRYPGHGMDVEKALSGCSEERPIVLLAHQPHAAKQALQRRPDINLVLSGTRSLHTSLTHILPEAPVPCRS